MMNENEFEKNIKQAFEDTTPDLLSQIKSDPRFEVPEKTSRFSLNSLLNRRAFAGVLSILVLSLVLLTAFNRLSEPVVASTVTIDINPSIVITLDEDDYIINVTGLNDEGDAVVDRDIKYRGLTIEELVNILVDRLEDSNYIITTSDDYNIILIDVKSDNSTKQAHVKTMFETKFNEKLSSLDSGSWLLDPDDFNLTKEQKNRLNEQFDMSMMSYAKATMIYRLSLLQDEYTVKQMNQMNVKQLYNLYISYEYDEYLPDYEQMPKPKNFGRN